MREISAQNSFNSQNDLRAHFGLGNAQTVDSVKVEWPSGQTDVSENIEANNFYRFIEGTGISATTSIEYISNLPDNFSLEQNYPNPFNPSTAITFTIPASNLVRNITLKVFDVLGNNIATIINGEKPSGKYRVNFDAPNLSSGIYFYRLTWGGFIQTKKMVLLR